MLHNLVLIEGRGYNCMPWRQPTLCNSFKMTGLIIRHHDKLYIVTTRSVIVHCDEINAIHYQKSGAYHSMMWNDMYVLYQSVKYDLVVLATINSDVFDPSQSNLFSSMSESPDLRKVSYDEYGYNIDDASKYVRPKSNSFYFAAHVDLELHDDIIFNISKSSVKYTTTECRQVGYLPETIYHRFDIVGSNNHTFKLHSSVVINNNTKIAGFVVQYDNNTVTVLPMQTVRHVIDTMNEINDRIGLSFDYNITPCNEIVITDVDEIITTDVGFTTGSKIISIDDVKLRPSHVTNTLQVYVPDYFTTMHLETYFELKQKTEINVSVNTDGKIYNCKVPLNIVRPQILISNASPTNNIPGLKYVSTHNIILAEITHELRASFYCENMQVTNNAIKNYDDDDVDVPIDYPLIAIVDCLDDDTATKYNLPQMRFDTEMCEYFCPQITHINRIKITNFDDVMNLDKINSLTFVDDQNKITYVKLN